MKIIHIQNFEQLKQLYKKLQERKIWSFDTETTLGEQLKRKPEESDTQYKKRRSQLLKSDIRLHPKKTQLFCISFYIPGVAYYYEIKSYDIILDELRKIFSLPNIKIAHRATFDINVMENYGVHVKPPIWCSKTMACIHDENDVEMRGDQIIRRYGLKFLAKKYLNAESPDVDMAKMDISEVPLEDRMKYCVQDSEWGYRLVRMFYRELKKQKLLPILRIEKNALPIFAEIERTGVRLDVKYLEKAFDILKEKQIKIEQKILSIIGSEINLNSSQQLAKVLFEDLGLPPGKKTKTGYSTDKNVLRNLKNKHPVIPLLLKRKSIEKVKGTYIEPYLNKAYKGRLYFELRAWGTRSGRTSSANPNFGNLPRVNVTGWSGIPKKAILPDKGHVFISADGSQVEYRFLAGLSGDPRILRAYKNDPNTDFHKFVAKDFVGDKWDQMTKEQKKKARDDKGKKVNFATVYGQSDKALAELLGITEDKAERFHNKYFIKFPGIRSLQNNTFRLLEKHGYVRSYFGRKRRLPGIYSKKWGEKDHAKRQGFNFRVQSPASADLTKIDMYNVDKFLKREYPGKARIVLTVYDELLISCHKEIANEVSEEVKYIMEQAIDFPVPLLVDVKIKERWGGEEID